jgi:hydrogenase/urease accessory protein HupE
VTGARLCLRLCLAASFVASVAAAHDARPIYVEVTEAEPGVFSVQWKVPPTIPADEAPRPVPPPAATVAAEPAILSYRDAILGRATWHCPEGLSGRELAMDFPAVNPSLSTLFRVTLLGGEVHSHILKPDERSWIVPSEVTRRGVAKDYTVLGVRHIWEGVDHLLFVACLLWVAVSPRRVLATITGFTLAHSLTLALSALDIVRVPVPPVEAAIALSIVFLAVEIAAGDRRSLAYRFPIAVSISFGLLHGFGFAAVLRQVGLPPRELPTALLFFNLGVEIGQVLFVFALGALLLLLRQLAHHWLRRPDSMMARLRLPACYVVGTIASFWLVERVAGFWL